MNFGAAERICISDTGIFGPVFYSLNYSGKFGVP